MAEPDPEDISQSDPENISQSDPEEMPLPNPQRISRHLRNAGDRFHDAGDQLYDAGDEIALFSNLRAMHDVTELQELTKAIKGMQKDLKTIKKDVGKVQTDMIDMRTEMRASFTRLETRISVVYVFISFRDSRLTPTRSDHNSLARAHNATINNSRSTLQGLKTRNDVVPNGFPATSAELSTLTGMRHFHGLERRITLTNFSSSAQSFTHCVRATYQ